MLVNCCLRWDFGVFRGLCWELDELDDGFLTKQLARVGISEGSAGRAAWLYVSVNTADASRRVMSQRLRIVYLVRIAHAELDAGWLNFGGGPSLASMAMVPVFSLSVSRLGLTLMQI